MKLQAFLFVMLAGTATMYGQEEREKADALFAAEQYGEALPHYLRLVAYDTANAFLNLKTGLCYLYSRSEKKNAVPFLERALLSRSQQPENSDLVSLNIDTEEEAGGYSPVLARKFLGDAYYLASDFKPAVLHYEQFLDFFKDREDTTWSVLQEVKWKMQMCRIGMELGKSTLKKDSAGKYPVPVYGNYSFALSGDQSTMTFTFQQPGMVTERGHPGFFAAGDIAGAKGRPALLGDFPAGDKITESEATVATSVDGQVVLIYKNEKGLANLYITRLEGNQWTIRERLNKTVNKQGWEQEESISADGGSLYFTSDRPGGYGGKDIYSCKKSAHGEWAQAVNLGPLVNSAYDEEAPFVQPGGGGLYFSSAHPDSKQFDIYVTTLSDSGTWRMPVRTGYPVSQQDTFNLAQPDSLETLPVKASKPKRAKKSRDENVKKGPEEKNYLVTFIDQKANTLTLLKGRVACLGEDSPVRVSVTVADNATGRVFSVYHPDGDGQFSFFLPQGSSNIAFEAEGYLFRSLNMDVSPGNTYYTPYPDICLAPLKPGAKTSLHTVFPGPGKILQNISSPELMSIQRLLHRYPAMVIEIAAYVNEGENEKSNTRLAQGRAQAIADRLIASGIAKARLVVKGYGRLKKSKGEEHDQAVELKVLKM